MTAKIKKPLAAVVAAKRAVSAAQINFNRVVKENFPIGAPVAWRIGGCSSPLRTGYVVDHGYQDRLKVTNRDTGKSRWIMSHDMYEVD